MEQGFEDIVRRMNNAMTGFVESIMRCGGVSEMDAQAVANFYIKEKLAKMNATIGSISVKNGVYLEKDVILRAVKMAKTEKAKRMA